MQTQELGSSLLELGVQTTTPLLDHDIKLFPQRRITRIEMNDAWLRVWNEAAARKLGILP